MQAETLKQHRDPVDRDGSPNPDRHSEHLVLHRDTGPDLGGRATRSADGGSVLTRASRTVRPRRSQRTWTCSSFVGVVPCLLGGFIIWTPG